MTIWINEAIDRAVTNVRRIAHHAADFPHITEKGEWQYTPNGVWTGGFWAGLLWLAAEHEGGGLFAQQARGFTDRLLPRQADSHNHDLGFMFYPSAVRGWLATGEDKYRQAAVTAAHALSAQFNEVGGFIPGWGFFGGKDWGGAVLVDTLMNLPLLVWASHQDGDPRLLEVVRRHAATSLRHHLRPDGSVFHVYRFDEHSGDPLRGDTYQGLSPDSAWSRGQAWALTGLAMLAGMLNDATYREASERVATYFIRRLPSDGGPSWDFDATGPNEPKDASAGAIASYGLLKLNQVTGNQQYLDSATRLLHALSASCANTNARGGLLLHATADKPHGFGIDESTMYGDYYYLKSLVHLRKMLDNA